MNTVLKLNWKHPDGSLTIETLDRIYLALIKEAPGLFEGEELSEEYRWLMSSRMRILMHEDPKLPMQEIEDFF